MKLGELFAIARECKGWTLREMEERCGVSNALLSQIENGKVKDPGFSTIIRIVDALGLSWERVIKAGRPFNVRDVLRTRVVGKVTGEVHEGDQVPGMPGAICHACGLGFACHNPDCPNETPAPAGYGPSFISHVLTPAAAPGAGSPAQQPLEQSPSGPPPPPGGNPCA